MIAMHLRCSAQTAGRTWEQRHTVGRPSKPGMSLIHAGRGRPASCRPYTGCLERTNLQSAAKQTTESLSLLTQTFTKPFVGTKFRLKSQKVK